MLTTVERQPKATKRKGGISTEVTTVSPDVAAAWLAVNYKNRKVKTRAVAQYARDMKAGSWRLTGDAIRFDEHGNLIDGQHRLLACVESGQPFESFVVYGLPNEVQGIIDAGVSRSAADAIHLMGINNAITVSSMAKVLIGEREGRSESRNKVSHSEIIAVLNKHKSMPLYAIPGGILSRGVPQSCTSYLYFVASTFLDQKKRADAMIAVLKTGIPDYENDPIHQYRERALKTGETALRAPKFVHLNTLKYCWNLFVEQKPLGVLRWMKNDVAIDGLNLKKL